MEIFGPDDKTFDNTRVVTSTWSDNVNILTSHHTSSTQAVLTSATSSGAFFIDVHNNATTSSVQYSIAYGHKAGSGSLGFTTDANHHGYSPSSVTYNQYRNLVYGDRSTNFTFNGYTPDDIYVINVNRALYKQNLKPSTFNLKLSASGQAYPLELTDDSITTTGSSVTTNIGRQFNIVSGSSGVMSGSLSSIQSQHPLGLGSGSYGLFYPDAGIAILNPDAISASLNGITNTAASNTANNNHQNLYNALVSGSIQVDSEETISSYYYFARIKNRQYNYTTNPTFRNNNGNLLYTDMEQNPKVYITTVGLYNDDNDLLAVAKLSQPITKEFSKEALIRIKLDY